MKNEKITLYEARKRFPRDSDLLKIVKTGKDEVWVFNLCEGEKHTAPSKSEILFYACLETGVLKETKEASQCLTRNIIVK